MEKKEIRYWLIIVILALSAGWSVFVYSRVPDIKQEIEPVKIPYSLSGWEGRDLPLSSQDFETIASMLETDKIMLRAYVNKAKERLMLYIVESKNRSSFHPPEYCYEGSGSAELIEKGINTFTIDNRQFSVYQLIYQRPNTKEMLFIWYMEGNASYESYYRQQLELVLGSIKGQLPTGRLIRISAYFSSAEGRKQAQEDLENFAGQILPFLEN